MQTDTSLQPTVNAMCHLLRVSHQSTVIMSTH